MYILHPYTYIFANQKNVAIYRANKITASVIVALWNIILIASIIRKLYCLPTSKNDPVINKGVKYASLTMFYALIIAHTSHILLFTFGSDRDNILFYVIVAIFYLAFAFAFFAYYIFMVVRLYHVFQNSIYAMTKKAIYFHVCILVCCCFIYGIAIIFYEVLEDFTTYYICLSLCTILFASGFSQLVYSFNSNLFALVLSKRRLMIHFPSPTLNSMATNKMSITMAKSSSIEETTENQSPQLTSIGNTDGTLSITDTFTERQLVLLRTIIKHTVLGAIMILMIILFIMINILSLIIGGKSGEVLFWWGQVVSTCTVTTCVFMGFRVNHWFYTSFCTFCDRKCSNFCEYCANQQVLTNEFGMELREENMQVSNTANFHTQRPTVLQVKMVIAENNIKKNQNMVKDNEELENQQTTESSD